MRFQLLMNLVRTIHRDDEGAASMSSTDTRETIEALLRAFEEGGLEQLAGFYAPNYANRTPFPGAPSTLAGHAAFEQWAARHLEFLGSEPVHVIADETRAAVLSRNRLRARATGEEFDAFGFAVVCLEDGKVVENWGGYDPVAVLRMQRAGMTLPDTDA
jgi:ketosteroid isomerase-like protein